MTKSMWTPLSFGVGLLSGFGPLVPFKGNLNATACNDVSDYGVLPALW